MTRHRTYRVITYKTETVFVDVAARDEEQAVARAEKLWEAGQQQQFHPHLESQPVRFEVDQEASAYLSEVVNEDRARWAERALKAFARDTGSGTSEEGVTDLICDLGHYAHSAGIDFADLLQRAGRTWAEEIIDEVQP